MGGQAAAAAAVVVVVVAVVVVAVVVVAVVVVAVVVVAVVVVVVSGSHRLRQLSPVPSAPNADGVESGAHRPPKRSSSVHLSNPPAHPASLAPTLGRPSAPRHVRHWVGRGPAIFGR